VKTFVEIEESKNYYESFMRPYSEKLLKSIENN
jgi:hypothetical protein